MRLPRTQTGKPIVLAPYLFAATWDQQAFVAESSALKSLAVKLAKIGSDLILLSSGPRAGLGEINLPPMQPGSSIMPGKVNPVIPELTNLVAFRVVGNDTSVTLAAAGAAAAQCLRTAAGLAILDSQHLLINTMRLCVTRAWTASPSTTQALSTISTHGGHRDGAESHHRL